MDRLSENKKCKIYAKALLVDKTKCTKCGECIKYCPFTALKLGSDGYPTPLIDRCTVCLVCMALCDPRAIKIVPDWTCIEAW